MDLHWILNPRNPTVFPPAALHVVVHVGYNFEHTILENIWL